MVGPWPILVSGKTPQGGRLVEDPRAGTAERAAQGGQRAGPRGWCHRPPCHAITLFSCRRPHAPVGVQVHPRPLHPARGFRRPADRLPGLAATG